jgi:hypothetical protein
MSINVKYLYQFCGILATSLVPCLLRAKCSNRHIISSLDHYNGIVNVGAAIFSTVQFFQRKNQ